MEPAILMLTVTCILLIIGIVGTVVGITRLIYPSSDRHYHRIRAGRNLRERRELLGDDYGTVKRRNHGT
jgi:hypothetical protein